MKQTESFYSLVGRHTLFEHLFLDCLCPGASLFKRAQRYIRFDPASTVTRKTLLLEDAYDFFVEPNIRRDRFVRRHDDWKDECQNTNRKRGRKPSLAIVAAIAVLQCHVDLFLPR